MLKCELKIQIKIGNSGTERTEPAPFFHYRKYLLQHGIKITNDKPDILFCHHRLMKKDDLERPLVIIERADSSILFQDVVRENISNKNVLAVIKTTSLRDKSLHNAPVYFGRYHCGIINDYLGKPNNIPAVLIDNQSLEKIHVLIPTAIQERFKSYARLGIDHYRDIDVSFVVDDS